MTHHATHRLYQAVTRLAQRRDQIEMQTINRLLAPMAPHGRPRTMSGAATRRLGRSGFRSILCPVDFSVPSRLALRYAAGIATRSHGRLSILYVNDPLLTAAAGIVLHDRTVARRDLAELHRFVESTVSPHVIERARIDEFVATGKPVGEILKAATRGRCDLIVMGTHGLTGVDGLLIGSTTKGVFRRSRVPVLAVPGQCPGRTRTRAPGGSWPGERIIVPVALDRRSLHEANAAARVARWLGAAALLVHVIPAANSVLRRQKKAGTADRIRISRAQSRLASLGVRVLRHAAVQTRVLVGETAAEIAKVAATERAGLVITTLRTPRDWFGSRRGSISYDVLSQATTPVLALPG